MGQRASKGAKRNIRFGITMPHAGKHATNMAQFLSALATALSVPNLQRQVSACPSDGARCGCAGCAFQRLTMSGCSACVAHRVAGAGAHTKHRHVAAAHLAEKLFCDSATRRVIKGSRNAKAVEAGNAEIQNNARRTTPPAATAAPIRSQHRRGWSGWPARPPSQAGRQLCQCKTSGQ